jgi:HSP20 family molecular chaperone IbpA
MTDNQSMEVQDQEIVNEETERTRDCQCYIPRADIYEVDEIINVVMDMPGIDPNAIDITLEKNVLNVKGFAHIPDRDKYTMVSAEYEPGDYERSFRISDTIDREKIDANYKDGVLRLTLPRAEIAKTKKIEVKVK